MRSRRLPLFLTVLICIASAVVISSVRKANAASSDPSIASYSHGFVHLVLPYDLPRAGAGQLSLEILNPEDEVLGRSELRVDASEGKSAWREDVKLTKPVAPDELVWDRVRYRFAYAGSTGAAIQNTESISGILRMPVLHILGQQSYLSGARAAARVVVTDTNNEPAGGPSSVRIDLITADQKSQRLFAGPLNQRGTTEAQFILPKSSGAYSLRYAVDTPIGYTEFTQTVRIEDKASILLTTEKPIYQPGQTIHIRALALGRAQHHASAARPLTFEVEDSRGNKVFKKQTHTDQFGIASAEFALADEVNLGAYHVRALMGETEGAPNNTAEIALNVEKYVLPKFKVAVEFTSKAKHGYRPGDRVSGTVRANYFFGKPVEGGEVSLKASGMDVTQFEAAVVHGKTDADGVYHFDLGLPAYFAGRPLEQGAARVLVEATVKDSASHSETRGEAIVVSQSPLLITAVPEGGALTPNLENQIFLLTSYADGTPAQTKVRVANQNLTTDTGGIAVLRLKAGADAEVLQIDASDAEGNRASSSVRLNPRQGDDQVLLRTERAVYRAGDPIQAKVFSTKARGTAYVDVVREGQIILTRDVDIVNGQAELSLTATPDLAGTVDLHAYVFGRDARPAGDHRLIFVQPADELKIEAHTDAAAYKPGDDARIRFRVTNSHGEGVQAALGLQVVDEAVFALAEKQPGFAKVFFYLEQEAMKPRYEIHSIGMPDVVEPVITARPQQRDLAARALFAATEMVHTNQFETEYGRTIPMTKTAEYMGRYRTRLVSELRRKMVTVPREGEIALRDSWGTRLRFETVPWDQQKKYYMVRSAGPDKQFNSGDDLGVMVEVRKRIGGGDSGTGPSSIGVEMEHDRGPYNGRAEIAVTVADQSGTAVEGASIRVRAVPSGKLYHAVADASGRFSLAALTPGDFEVEVSTPSETVSRKITLAVRDRAIVSAVLRHQAQESVLVIDPPRRIRIGGNLAQFDIGALNGVAGGVPGGIAGGVIGGIIGGVPQAAPMFVKQKMLASAGAAVMVTGNIVASDSIAAPRVRSYFPEALYINPEIITNQDGEASISIPMADSITTWRMAMVGSTAAGSLGSGASSIKVFQDFFVDLDLPVRLTQGDRVSIPVAAYNYSDTHGDVQLSLQSADWFSLVNDVSKKTVAVEAGRVGAAQFTLEAKRIGKFKLTIVARMTGATERADIVEREIEVAPDGREQNQVFNGRLETSAQHDVNFPAASIADASKIFVRLYPGPLSQVIEGMDSILRMPGGCFEQTSSSTYPNILALDYMKRTKKLTPEVHAKAEGFIANGYQRLLTFEVPGGGFSWFGQAPANKILTSYGLMEFSDMAQVHDVDGNLIARTQAWLANQQQADGSWKPDTSFINEGATNRFNTDLLRITAYIGWALETTGYQGPAVEKARQFVRNYGDAKPDSYTLAVLANFAADGKDRQFTQQAIQRLLDARIEKDQQVWWNSPETAVFGAGASASIETTGLAVQALLKSGQASAIAGKALRYIASKKDAAGTWGTTQATIMALRALLLSTSKGAADVQGTVEITLNGKPVQKLVLDPSNNDLLHQFVLKDVQANAANSVGLRFEGKGGLAYQVVGRYFVPWKDQPAGEPLTIDVAYGRTHLAQDDIATAVATIRNNLDKPANMVMVDLGIPPGFDLLSEDLQDYQEKTSGAKSGRLEKFSQTATQAILYFDSIGAGKSITLNFRLRAKYPIRARTFESRVYEYYDPEVNSVARPVQLEVARR